MPPDPQQPRSEREQTDDSLRREREKADEALGERSAEIDAVADAVIVRARERADQVLAATRAKVDRQLADSAHATQSPETVEKERVREDRAVRAERADADEALRDERAEYLALISANRGETDKDLLAERTRSDATIATRDEFLGIVSHDLRNMLGSIVNFAALIEKGVERRENVAQVVMLAQRIGRSSARMNRLIGDLIDVASIEAGRLAVTLVPADPGPIVTEAVETFQAHAAKTGVAIAADIESGLPHAAFDPARILQVLANFLSNAIKFTPSGGEVAVRVERAGDDLRFAVSDTGVGIAPGHLEAVFERFVQVNQHDRRGVGLGLYISKCIVQGHGGRIWAESEVGSGSTFFFTIPIPGAAGAP